MGVGGYASGARPPELLARGFEVVAPYEPGRARPAGEPAGR